MSTPNTATGRPTVEYVSPRVTPNRHRVPWTAALSGQLRALRGEAQWTLEELAQRSGVPKPSVERYLNGKQMVPVDVLAALCEAFGVDPVEVFARAARKVRGGPGPDI